MTTTYDSVSGKSSLNLSKSLRANTPQSSKTGPIVFDYEEGSFIGLDYAAPHKYVPLRGSISNSKRDRSSSKNDNTLKSTNSSLTRSTSK